MPMPLILALLFGSEFGAGPRGDDPGHQRGAVLSARYPDQIRSRATGAFRFVNYGFRPIGAFLGGVLGTALGVLEALFVTAVATSLRVLSLIGSKVLRLLELPDVAVLEGSTAAVPD